MKPPPLPGASAPELVRIIDFKWLARGAGMSVHVERMQTDPAYARDCLNEAVRAGQGVLQRSALQLADEMGLTLDPVA